jgi:uncharacterized MnhB-related membrane protein
MSFDALFAAVLGANLLTVMFVWGCVNISRREQRQEGPGAYLGAFLMPLIFAAASMMIAFDKVPTWLDAALQ